MADLTNFDKSVMSFFDVCKNILQSSEKRNLSLSDRKNPYMVRLEKYMKTYSKTDPEEHVVYFEKLYTSNKRFILLGPQRDSWLIDGKHIISFGEDCGLKTDMKLHVTGIYTTAVKLRDEIREESDGLPYTNEASEVKYPTKFLLFLYKIFREITSSETEKKKLQEHVESLEQEIGVRSEGGNDPMAGIFDTVSSMAEQFTGTKIPKDKMPSKQDFGKMISSVMDNPQTKTVLGSMMQKLQNSNNIGEIVGELVGNLTPPKEEVANSNNEVTTSNTNELVSVNDEFSD